MKKMNKPKVKNVVRHSDSGYTLIEVVIAMTMTTVAFVSIYALFAKSMQSDAESRYEIVASSLAQEGIEIIKNKREKNEMDWAMWKNKNDDGDVSTWGSFKDIKSLNNCNPSLDWSSDYSFNCANGNSINMQYNKGATSKEYVANCSESDCVGPVFKRRCTSTGIDTNSDGDNDSLRVVCTVTWKSLLIGGADRKAKAESVFTDWQR